MLWCERVEWPALLSSALLFASASRLHRVRVMKVLEAHHLQKTYRQGGREVRAVVDVSLTLAAGRSWLFWGPTGRQDHHH